MGNAPRMPGSCDRGGDQGVRGDSDCSRISGLRVEPRRYRAMRESARGEPIAVSGLNRTNPAIGFPARRSEPITLTASSPEAVRGELICFALDQIAAARG